ncbi:hypothetical protein [Streptomyces sp. NPDC005408]|uniref:hypothetical protein n=1 Tax=Streptomyces sp. NPDC005408 TaxID=3155341 RepID=UPI0033BE9769
MSLNGGLAETLGQAPVLNGGKNMVKDVAGTAMDVNNLKGNAPQEVLKTAGKLTPMLGGVELGG